MPNVQSTLLSEPQAAALLRIGTSTLRRIRRCGNGPRHIRIGAAIRYRPSDLAAWVEAHAVEETAR